MDPATIVVVATTFAGAQVARKVTDDVVDHVWLQLKAWFQARFGRSPRPEELSAVLAASPPDAFPILDDAERLFSHSTVLRRARFAAHVLAGASILWIDDLPALLEWERALFTALGIRIEVVTSTTDALSAIGNRHFDLVISDIDRDGIANAGLAGLDALRLRAPTTPVAFYIAALDLARGTPPGAVGITNRPDDLLHLVLDSLERTRI